MMMLRRSLCRSLPAAVRATTMRRSMASVADGLGLELPDKFDHFIGGEFVAPADGEYFDNVSPIDGQNFIKAARGSKADIDKAVDVRHAWSAARSAQRTDP
jgi:aldehyde dehydrogenase